MKKVTRYYASWENGQVQVNEAELNQGEDGLYYSDRGAILIGQKYSETPLQALNLFSIQLWDTIESFEKEIAELKRQMKGSYHMYSKCTEAIQEYSGTSGKDQNEG